MYYSVTHHRFDLCSCQVFHTMLGHAFLLPFPQTLNNPYHVSDDHTMLYLRIHCLVPSTAFMRGTFQCTLLCKLFSTERAPLDYPRGGLKTPKTPQIRPCELYYINQMSQGVLSMWKVSYLYLNVHTSCTILCIPPFYGGCTKIKSSLVGRSQVCQTTPGKHHHTLSDT